MGLKLSALIVEWKNSHKLFPDSQGLITSILLSDTSLVLKISNLWCKVGGGVRTIFVAEIEQYSVPCSVREKTFGKLFYSANRLEILIEGGVLFSEFLSLPEH